MWDLITLAQFPGSEIVSTVIPRHYGCVWLFPLVIEHSVVVMSARPNPMVSQF